MREDRQIERKPKRSKLTNLSLPFLPSFLLITSSTHNVLPLSPHQRSRIHQLHRPFSSYPHLHHQILHSSSQEPPSERPNLTSSLRLRLRPSLFLLLLLPPPPQVLHYSKVSTVLMSLEEEDGSLRSSHSSSRKRAAWVLMDLSLAWDSAILPPDELEAECTPLSGAG